MPSKKELSQGGNLILGSGLIRVDKTWDEFKLLINGSKKRLSVQFEENGDRYRAFAIDENVVYICDLVKVPESYDETFNTQAKVDAHNTARQEFENSFKNKSNKPIMPTTDKGAPVVSARPAEGSRLTLVSHNWCDKTTWYQESTRVLDEIAVCQNAPTYTVYSVSHTNLIDTYHGKVFQEDFLEDGNGNSYRVVVKVNDVVKTERDPHYASGGDYVINYVTGEITFTSALTVTDVVKVTYHYATTSRYTIKPLPGKILKIKAVEVQFSVDIQLNDAIRFQPYVGGYPYGNAMVYKNMTDYINEANGMLPQVPALATGNWRGLSQSVITFPWLYQTVTTLQSSYAAEIQISLDHDTSFGGTYATATFYCLVEDE